MREIAEDFRTVRRFIPQGIEKLQVAAEAYMAKIFEDAHLLARHDKRITVKKTSFMLLRRIFGE